MQRNIKKDFLIVIIIVIIGKTFGFFRELIIAYLFGSSVITDAFYYANGLITSFFTIITTGLAQAFTPIYLDLDLKLGKGESSRFVNTIISMLVLIGAILSTITFAFPEKCITILAPDLTEETLALSAKMLRYLSVCIPVYIAFSIRKCILTAHEKYFITEASGIPYSIAISVVTLLLFNHFGYMSIVIAAISGVFFQYVFTLLFSHDNYLYSFQLESITSKPIKQYFYLLAPLIMNAVFDEANSILRKSLAGGMGEGSIANLNYCMNLTTIVNGIIITSITTVIFPHLIKNNSQGKREEFQNNIETCFLLISVSVIPVVAFLIFNSYDIVKVVYERGQFSSEDTKIVSSLFSIYSLGAIVYAYRFSLRTAFYAVQDTKTPVINELCFLIITILCNLFQVKILGLGLNALGIAWVVAMVIMTPFLFRKFARKHCKIMSKSTAIEIIKTSVSTIVSLAVFLFLDKAIITDSALIGLIINGVCFFIVYCCGLVLLKSQMVSEAKIYIGRKFGGK